VTLVAVVVSSGINFFKLYNTVLVVRLVLTWFPNTPPAIVGPLRHAYHRTCLYNIDHATALSDVVPRIEMCLYESNF
jgi:hypothetical protein